VSDFQATFGDLVIDGLAWEVTLGGAIIDLTRTEFEILLVLASRPRQVVTDGQLVRKVWGDGWFGDENNVAVHVSKLRRKLGESGLHPRFIRTVRGVGYRFDPQGRPPAMVSVQEVTCQTLSRHPSAVEFTSDDQLRVLSVRPDDRPIFGFEPRHVLGNYFPLIAEHPWDDHVSALQSIQAAIANGVRHWTARRALRQADGTLAQADIAVSLKVSSAGNLETLRAVVLEIDGHAGGGGGSLISGNCGGTRLA
jgi:DNA-binding winged helix-turn-helix (wHTH) protein